MEIEHTLTPHEAMLAATILHKLILRDDNLIREENRELIKRVIIALDSANRIIIKDGSDD